jgi:hypothetical protein
MSFATYKLGTLVTDTITGLKNLTGYASLSFHYATFEYPQAIDYQVPAGKKFIITKLIFYSGDVAAVWKIGYGDDGVADGIVSPTNLVYILRELASTPANTLITVETYLEIPALKYPCMYTVSNGVWVNVMGIEL